MTGRQWSIAHLGASFCLAVLTFGLLVSLMAVGASPPTQEVESLDLTYLLTIDDPGSGLATVVLTVINILTDVLEVEEHGYKNVYANILALSAKNSAGNPLSAEYYSYTNYMGVEKDTWRIECAGSSQIIIEYKAQIGIADTDEVGNPLQWGHLGPDWAVMAGEYVFLIPKQPVPNQSGVGSVAVLFDLPEGWEPYTPWPQYDSVHFPTSQTADILDHFCWSSFALGHFDLYSRTIGMTDMRVAAHYGFAAEVQEAMAQRAWDIIAYQTSVFDSSVGDFYLAIFVPKGADGQRVMAGEWSNSQGFSPDIGPDGTLWSPGAMFAHQTFHRWNAFDIGFWGGQAWWIDGPAEVLRGKDRCEVAIWSGCGSRSTRSLQPIYRGLRCYWRRPVSCKCAARGPRRRFLHLSQVRDGGLSPGQGHLLAHRRHLQV